MIIVNTTFVLHHDAADEIVAWMRDAYARSAARSGAVSPAMLTRILANACDDDNESYAMHITFPDMTTARKWNEGVAESLRALLSQRWGERALTFHTYLEVIE